MEDVQKENAYLVDLILAKGDIDNVRFENAQDKVKFLLNFNMQDKYKELQVAKVETLYETEAQSNANHMIRLNNVKNDISSNAENILKERNVDVPLLLSETQKEKTIIEALKNLGLEQQDVDAVVKNGLKNTETINGEEITLTFQDNEKVKEILEKNEVVYKKTEKGLEVDANLVAQEGIEIENNKKNKKILEENDITHYIKPDDPRKIFVPLRAKKVATLLAASVIIGPVPAIALQIILNKTGLLDKMVDRHLITLKQRAALNNGQTILVKQRIEGKDVEQYMFKDENGKIKRVNKEDIQIRFPKKLNGHELTPEDIQRLKSGKHIDIYNDGKMKTYVMDLRKPNGVAEVKYNKNGITELKTPTPISNDNEKLDYISRKGASGLSDIFGHNPVNPERDKFLDKYNLRTEFRNYNNAEKNLKLAEILGNPTVMLIAKLKEFGDKLKDAAMDVLLIDVEEKQGRGMRR